MRRASRAQRGSHWPRPRRLGRTRSQGRVLQRRDDAGRGHGRAVQEQVEDRSRRHVLAHLAGHRRSRRRRQQHSGQDHGKGEGAEAQTDGVTRRRPLGPVARGGYGCPRPHKDGECQGGRRLAVQPGKGTANRGEDDRGSRVGRTPPPVGLRSGASLLARAARPVATGHGSGNAPKPPSGLAGSGRRIVRDDRAVLTPGLPKEV